MWLPVFDPFYFYFVTIGDDLSISQEHCMSCRGSGVVEGIKDVKVTIPEGLL